MGLNNSNLEKAAQDFEKILSDPNSLASLQRRIALQEFKDKYNVARATPLHCPACSDHGYAGGSLWINKDDPNRFICRKCLLEWKLECLTTPNIDLITKIREASK